MSIYSWISPFTDRADAVGFNATDFNRIGNNLLYLAEKLNQFSYPVNISPRTNWVVGEPVYESQAAALLSYITTIRGAIAIANETPVTPESMAFFTWIKANDIEKILQNVYLSVSQLDVYADQIISGTCYSGNDLLNQRFSRGR